jgi:hypothetical protein
MPPTPSGFAPFTLPTGITYNGGPVNDSAKLLFSQLGLERWPGSAVPIPPALTASDLLSLYAAAATALGLAGTFTVNDGIYGPRPDQQQFSITPQPSPGDPNGTSIFEIQANLLDANDNPYNCADVAGQVIARYFTPDPASKDQNWIGQGGGRVTIPGKLALWFAAAPGNGASVYSSRGGHRGDETNFVRFGVAGVYLRVC